MKHTPRQLLSNLTDIGHTRHDTMFIKGLSDSQAVRMRETSYVINTSHAKTSRIMHIEFNSDERC